MRKLFLILLCSILAVTLFGCGGQQQPVTTDPQPSTTVAPTEPEETDPVTQPPTEPAPTEPVLDTTKLYGIDVTGMTAEEAKAAINDAITSYTLSLTANGKSFTFTGKELSLALSDEAFAAWFEDASQGNQPSPDGLISYNIDKALASVKEKLEEEPQNAYVVYKQTVKRFAVESHRDGIAADVSSAERAMKNAISTLSPAVSASVRTEPAPAEIKDDDPRVSRAIASANSYLSLQLTYVYQADGIPTSRETISVDTLGSFITVDEDLSVEIAPNAVKEYIQAMLYKNGGAERRGFITSHGTTLSQTVDYYGISLDQDGMYNDLVYCLQNKISGERNAPFLSVEISNMPYGGSYVEIDLDNQCLWVYRNGNLAIHTPLVSGKVSSGYATPNGVYSIYGKTTGTYLVGPTWRSYVDYWMPFNGGIGLHDASWRSVFGGTIYMYDGSHGCINLPPKAAKVVFNNISIGTKVIVYGGEKTTGKLTQTFTGTDSYNLTTEDDAFRLDVIPKYTGTTLHYSSSNSNVVTVDSDGVVTIVGPGSATITVTSDKLGILNSATFEISITVVDTSEPDPTDPDPTEPDPTEPDPTEPDPTEPDPTEPDPTEPDPTEPDPTEPDPTEPAPTEPDLTEPEATEPPKEETGD